MTAPPLEPAVRTDDKAPGPDPDPDPPEYDGDEPEDHASFAYDDAMEELALERWREGRPT